MFGALAPLLVSHVVLVPQLLLAAGVSGKAHVSFGALASLLVLIVAPMGKCVSDP